jgi:DNA polymerase-3 subunit epsilon
MTVAVPLCHTRFAVVDVETSGLSRRRHRLLQVAVVIVTGDGEVVERWSSPVRPRFGRVGPTHIHGLTARSLRCAPTFAEIAPELVRRLEGVVFTAHNAEFDWGFVADALQRNGYRPPDAVRLCTARLSRAVAVDAPSHRLTDVCARHGITITRAHDAAADAEATAAVLPHLFADGGLHTNADLGPFLRGRGEPWPAWTAPPWWRRVLYR